MDPKYRMIEEIKNKYHLSSSVVFEAMLKVPRDKFVPPMQQGLAYTDSALSIGYGQTISQPYTVAFMTHLISSSLSPSLRKKVLEIGTGSGYQAAILSFLFNKVYTVEIIPELAKATEERLKKLGFKNVEVRTGNGEEGWREESPFDAIIVTAGMGEVPKELFNQLKMRGVLVAPIGEGEDRVMTKFTKKKNRVDKKEYGIFNFVPFVENV